MTGTVETFSSLLCWKIENFSLRKGRLESPHFYSFNAEWCVEILLKDMCLSGDQIKIGFRQLTDHEIKVNWLCTFLNSEGSRLKISKTTDVVNNGKSCGECTWILKYDDVFNENNLPNDILTIESRIWQTNPMSGFPVDWEGWMSPLFLTHKNLEQYGVAIEKMFVWNVGLISYDPGHTVKHVEPMVNDKALTITLLKETNQRLLARLEMPICTVPAEYKIYLVYKNKHLEFKEDQFKTDNSSYIFYLNFGSFEEMKSFQWQNSMCVLLFTCTYYNTCSPEVLQSKQPPELDSLNTVSQDLLSMYEEGFLSDFSLRVQDKIFPVHKAILGARSSVFRSMFTADMKEKESGQVDIPDVDADTFQRMLKFIYFDSIQEDMQWESASSLYAAANKYALKPLKQRCSVHLRDNLSTVSVLCVLLLSDTHDDQVLKAAVLDFISRNDKEIIGSEKWDKFMEEHGPLSLETLQQLYLKKMSA